MVRTPLKKELLSAHFSEKETEALCAEVTCIESNSDFAILGLKLRAIGVHGWTPYLSWTNLTKPKGEGDPGAEGLTTHLLSS